MPHTHDFYTKLARVLNTGKSRSVLLFGNVYDLFFDGEDWVPLVDFLSKKCALKPTEKTRGVTQVIYEVNRPVRLFDDDGALANAWNDFKSVSLTDKRNDFDNLCNQTQENPTFAIEFLRQLTICSRKQRLKNDLLIIIEGVEMLVPPGNYAQLQFADRKRISIMLDWFSDPKFVNGHDSVIVLAESRSLIHPMISNLPQLISVEVPAPTLADRKKFSTDRFGKSVFAEMTAGLTLQAYRQLLCDENVDAAAVIEKVEEYIASQLGEDVVEFKRPTHTLKDVCGFTDIKNYIGTELIPRFKATGEEALPGAGIAGPVGCHRAGQGILMADGSIKQVEEVQVGDRLMGMDSSPREVLRLIHGSGNMYRIDPIKGDSFVVNEDHVLTLVKTCQKKYGKPSEKGGEIVDISVREWLSWSKWKQSIYKLFRVGVSFEDNDHLLVHPYFLGVLIGDGSVCYKPGVTTMDNAIVDIVKLRAKQYGLNVSIAKSGVKKCPTYFIVGKKKHLNPLTKDLREIGFWGYNCGDKFIPVRYLISNESNRLKLLAGIIDSDGHLHNNNYDINVKSKRLAQDICYLARSLGLAAYMKPNEKSSQNGTIGTYFRVNINGDTSKIPVKLLHKKAKPRMQKKSVLRTGFTVTPLGNGDFYGFTINGDGRYLLDDFTVTHNSGKSFIMEAMASELEMPVLVLKNIRSQWFGQTDVILERLKRVLIALEKVCIFADEADTLFGGLGSDTHETERRLTGKIQAMMSDPSLRGKVIWLLMTARIHRLSADIRRPGRVGDLIIPILDPEGEDRKEFICWLASAATDFREVMDSGRLPMYSSIDKATAGYSAAAFSALRSKVKAKKLNLMGLLGEAEDTLQADIGDARRYQILQALLNCTSKKLIPKQFITTDNNFDTLRASWRQEIQELERKGVD